MRVLVTVVDPRQDLSRDVVLQADDGVTVADTIPELVRAARAAPTTATNVVSIGVSTSSTTGSADTQHSNGVPVLYHLGERLDPTTPLAESGLREGSLISVSDPTASLLDEPPGLVELRLVSGPGAGGVHRLTVGEATIGSDPSCVVHLDDPAVPPVAAWVQVRPDGETTLTPYAVADEERTAKVGDELELSLDREAVDGTTDWPLGALLTVGSTMLELERVSEPDAAVEASAEAGWIDYNRPAAAAAAAAPDQVQAAPSRRASRPSRACPGWSCCCRSRCRSCSLWSSRSRTS